MNEELSLYVFKNGIRFYAPPEIGEQVKERLIKQSIPFDYKVKIEVVRSVEDFFQE